MATIIYTPFREYHIGRGFHWINDVIEVIAIDEGLYTFDSNHEYLDDVPVGARIATATLTGKTFNGGIFDADDTLLVWTGAAVVGAFLLFKRGATDGSSPLIAWFGTSDDLPSPPVEQITVIWPAGGIIQVS